MKLRLAMPAMVVDLGALRQQLSGTSTRDGNVVIWALPRHAEVLDSASVRQALPLLRDLASQVGDPQIRNMGTAGGSGVECDPAGDWGPGLLALNASGKCVSKRGERSISATDLFVDAYTTSVALAEVLTEVWFPTPGPRSGGPHF
jgi:carbon-monoxide dehydrogenase medium subunit